MVNVALCIFFVGNFFTNIFFASGPYENFGLKLSELVFFNFRKKLFTNNLWYLEGRVGSFTYAVQGYTIGFSYFMECLLSCRHEEPDRGRK